MKINNLINRKYTTVSVLEDMHEIAGWMNGHHYMAVVDEDLKPIGIVTHKDVKQHSKFRKIIDYDIAKPHVHPNQTILEVFTLMKNAQTDFLPVFENDEFFGVIALMTITERLTEALNETKQNYQKVIHDVRNPISNLQGLTDLLNESINDNENKELINLCNRSCKHAMDILDDLLFVELDESKPLTLLPTELNTFFKQCINEQKGLCFQKNIAIVTNFCAGPTTLDIDRKLIKRAVQNVISNAIKFSYPETAIKISTKTEKGRFILKIVDGGIGIPQELQPEIFKKFTSAQRMGTNGEASTGLGLCFTKQCMERHNGHISFKSTEGRGTKFYLAF